MPVENFWEFSMFACPTTGDFFRSRIDLMIDMRHPLSARASRMPWQKIEARRARVFSRKGRAGTAIPDQDLFVSRCSEPHCPTTQDGPVCRYAS